jgi:hypothetical protein
MRCILMNTTCRRLLIRIKSPQLYRLSYQPEVLESLGKASCQGPRDVAIVPAVCPGVFRERPYHGSTGREAEGKTGGSFSPSLRFIGGTVCAAWLLGGEP